MHHRSCGGAEEEPDVSPGGKPFPGMGSGNGTDGIIHFEQAERYDVCPQKPEEGLK